MNPCIIIPARYNSSRFPGKPLAKIAGETLISRVVKIAYEVLDPAHVYVATDSDLIRKHCSETNIKTIMTSDKNLTGTDRIAEAALCLNYDYYINLQGDEPTVDPLDLKLCIKLGKQYPNHVINFYHPIYDTNPSSTSLPKVVFNESNDLIYISRSLIPGGKDKDNISKNYNRQVCIYGFNKKHLSSFASLERKSLLEEKEDIEILRFFDLNIPIKVFLSRSCGPAVDYPSDIPKVINYLNIKSK